MTAFSTAHLEDALKNTEPMTEDDLARTMRLISRRAWEARAELGSVVARLGEANAQAEHFRTKATIASHVEHPERKVAHHKAIGDLAAEEHSAEKFALTHMERALHRELEILHELLISCAVQWKHLTNEDMPFDQMQRAS